MEKSQTNFAQIGGLSVAKSLQAFIEDEALPGTGISGATFWNGLAVLARDFGEHNRQLLETRGVLQSSIDAYYRGQSGQPLNLADYESFLRKIGYLLPQIEDFTIRTRNVDEEIAQVAGPQLVVPLSNARYALNAANARWGSLYDALYGSDAIPEDNGATRAGSYNPVRGERVIKRARALLDTAVPLAQGSHHDAVVYSVEGGALVVRLRNGGCTGLARARQFVGYRGEPAAPSVLLLSNNNLHIEININRTSLVGRDDPAGISDIALEAAVTTIMDLEDSVAAVDAEDKVALYRSWFGLMEGTLTASFEKGGKTIQRRLNPDKVFVTPNGGELRLPGRSLMLIRNVGHHMYTDAVLDPSRREIPEGILDAAVTALIALRDLSSAHIGRNSRTDSIYIVKPKMHGPDEVAFANQLFGRVDIRCRAACSGHPMPLNREPGCRAVIREQFLVSRLDHSVDVVGGIRCPVAGQTLKRLTGRASTCSRRSSETLNNPFRGQGVGMPQGILALMKLYPQPVQQSGIEYLPAGRFDMPSSMA